MPNKSTLLRLPAMADVHVHLRVPGGEHKEDFFTGSRAALAGGITTVLAMPNTTPPIITAETLNVIQAQATREALCDVHLFAGSSPDAPGELLEMAKTAVGLKLYMDNTFGPLRVTNLEELTHTVLQWPANKVIAMHAEDRNIAVGIGIAATYKRHVHFCHVSRKDEIELIAAAKAQGLPVTCEVTPHHLFLTDADAKRLGPLGDMRPLLATQADVDALWAHINTTIDAIATDHAPHTLEEKASETPPPGVPGLETSLPLMLNAMHEGRLSMDRLLDLMAYNPRRIYDLAEQPDTYIEVDTEARWEVRNDLLFTKCGWTPFTGMPLYGKVRHVVLRGKSIFRDGRFID